MMGYMFNVIYIGIPPKGGLCQVSPMQGIASVTRFTFTSSHWLDPDGIAEYRFLYSFDDGNTYIPLDQMSLASPSASFIFPPIFSSKKVRLQCNVKSLKGFFADSFTTFPLAMKTSASSAEVLQTISLDQVTNEAETL